MNTHKRQWVQRGGIVVALLLAFALGMLLRGSPRTPQQPEHTQQATLWTCAMHPQIQLPSRGPCPVCGMDLIPLQSDAASQAGPRSLTLSPEAATLAEIRTAAVVRRPVQAELRMVGKLEPDEGRVREISAWVAGRIERLFIDATGVRVRAGQELFELYSPELLSAQEELLQAIQASQTLSRSSLESSRRSATRTVEAARERLRLWGLTPEQIEAIEARGTAEERVRIVAPMSGVVLHKGAVEGAYVKTGTHVYDIADLSLLWLQLDVYEADLAWMQTGQKVTFRTEAYPGDDFEGTVSFINPVLDRRSRSIKVRVNVPNAEGRLKPGMFARAVVHASLTRAGQPDPLVIPRTAPLFTGTRAVVYVVDADHPGRYQGREVVLGREAGDDIVVLEGLTEGERVVSHGAFKIDSALQILARPSMMSAETVPDVPADFRRQLASALQHYFEVSDALSHDLLPPAQEAARALSRAIAQDASSLPEGLRSLWMPRRADITRSANALAGATTLDEAREPFQVLSNSMITVLRKFGAPADAPVFVLQCPMAFHDAGAEWLQPFEDTENPYFGASMFRCGSKVDTFVPAASSGHQGHRH